MFEQLAMQPFRLPKEEALNRIERDRSIIIQRDAFLSQEFYNCNHPKGKHNPVFWSNGGDGKHVPLVELDKLIYVVGRSGTETSKPIPLTKMNSGRRG